MNALMHGEEGLGDSGCGWRMGEAASGHSRASVGRPAAARSLSHVDGALLALVIGGLWRPCEP